MRDGKHHGPTIHVGQNPENPEEYQIREIHFIVGQRDGLARFWYADNQRLGARGSYVKGKLHGTYEGWDRSGRLRARCEFKKGKSPAETRKLWDAFGKPTELGPCRNQPDVGRTLATVHDQARYCYEKELAKTPSLTGKIVTVFFIDAMGFTSDISVTESTLENDDLERCMIRILERLWFNPAHCCSTEITYPWIFREGRPERRPVEKR